MIKIEVNEGNTESYIKGTVSEICSDCITAIHTIYEQLKEDDEESAERFKEVISNEVNLAFMTCDELDEEFKKREKKKTPVKEKVKTTLSEAVKMLDEGCSLDELLSFLQKMTGEDNE